VREPNKRTFADRTFYSRSFGNCERAAPKSLTRVNKGCYTFDTLTVKHLKAELHAPATLMLLVPRWQETTGKERP